MVLLAMGFLGPEKDIIKELSLDEDPRSNIDTPKGNYKTSVPKVYAAGGTFRFLCLAINQPSFKQLCNSSSFLSVRTHLHPAMATRLRGRCE